MDLDSVEPAFAKKEFLAVLIAGFGNELLPLTSNNGDEPSPKALLPVANKPLIEYVLSWLEQAGVKDVLLICPDAHQSALHHHINSDISPSALNVDLLPYNETLESPEGTASLLRHFASRITEDFVLVPCDFIPPPSLPLSALLNKFRIESTTNDAIVSTCWVPAYVPEKGVLLDEWGPVPAPPAIVWDPATHALLHVDTPDDLDSNSEEFELKMDLLSQYPRTKLSSSFQDSHVYVCQRRVLELLKEKKKLDSFREDFIPWLCKLQYQPIKRRKYARIFADAPRTQMLALKHSTLSSESRSSKAPQPHDDGEEPAREPTFKVSISIHEPTDSLALRINNVYTFLEANRALLSSTTYSLPSDSKDRSLIDHKVQISSDSIVGDSTQIAERTIIKRSVIGRHCVIGKGVKISGCILFDHCVVEDGAKLDGSILGKNTKVGSKAEMTRCISCPGFEVNGGDTLKGEKLDISDWTADQSVPADSSDDDDESSDEEDP
ncbi:nucleotide-diphospho-sugar transferase [Ephemerocybe angulata]|uniref:Translation initiation factor eIF2B subunit gamma n=1 Tax=Ephemerocybe angulata TaxID=980116 RepID=A0A8H6ICG8_9AGAR|nr:nucleotide-diphospho-sugar transferase [Tulosesus angulatus]